MSQALYRKWRPLQWHEIVGQPHIVQTLQHAVAADRIAHAYLFAGPRGVGKTTTARLLAKAANCLDPEPGKRPCNRCEHCLAVNQGRFLDLIEIDAASNTSVDDVRDLREKIGFSPNHGRFKVYIVDEVHMLSMAAFNALLKTLEEPPPHAMFILATTEVHKIPATVLSRCQRHEFRRIPVLEMAAYLKQMARQEGLPVEDAALVLIARQATGSLRDAISLLDLLASSGERVTLDRTQAVLGAATSQAVVDLVEALLSRKAAEGLNAIHHALDEGGDPRQFARQIVDYLRNLLLVRMADASLVDTSSELRAQMETHAVAFQLAGLLQAIRVFNQAANETRNSWQPSLPLELALMEWLNTGEGGTNPAPGTPAETPLDKPASSLAARGKGDSLIGPMEEPADTPASQAMANEGRGERGGAPSMGGKPDVGEQAANHDLNRNWAQILKLVRQQSPNTYGLLNSCRSRYLKGNSLILGFASDVLKNHLQKKENLELVHRVLVQVLEREVSIQCVIAAARPATIPPGVESDGMVAAALRDLGGEIVDIQ